MGKHKERIDDEYDYEGDAVQALFDGVDLEDDEFYERFQSKKTRRNAKRARNARRRIEEYWEDRQLAERLDEYYYHSDD